jgi:cell division protein ZapA (FtsZ GTPase activity inhibitor)
VAPEKRSIAVRLRGHEFRVRSDDDEERLQRVAGYLEETMAEVERRTGTVDSFDVALLTALNLARELVALRDERSGASGVDAQRLRALIELGESALQPDAT